MLNLQLQKVNMVSKIQLFEWIDDKHIITNQPTGFM